MRTLMSLASGTALLLTAGCGKKAPEATGPIEGWHQEAGWSGSCYYPKDYKSSDRMAGSEAREAIMSQWKGERDDGISFSASKLEALETVFLGKPDAVKSVAIQNLEFCQNYMKTGDKAAWQKWFSGLKSVLTTGDCKWPPLRYQQHDYLDLGKGWQFEGRVCKGDRVRIEVSSLDKYRLSDDGPWMTGAGDTSQRAVGEGYPCNLETCFHGMVVYKFTDLDGVETVGPVGIETVFNAPSDGTLELRVNEPGDSFFDNVWRKKGSLIDHSSIAYIGLE